MGAWQSPEAWVWDQGPVCVPRSKKAGPHTLPDTERPREHDCTLFSHDACPAQGGLWGLHLGQRVQNRPLPSPDQVVTGGGDQRPRHTLDCTLPMCPLASAPPPLKPPGWVPEWPLQGSGGSGGWGARERGSSLEATAGTARVAGSHGPSLRGGPRHQSPGREKGGRHGQLWACPPGSASGVPLLPGALPGQRWTRNARRGHLPGGEAGGLGSRCQVQSFPWLCRFLSVHLLQD